MYSILTRQHFKACCECACHTYTQSAGWYGVIVHTVAHRKQYKITIDNVIRILTVDTCTCVCGIYLYHIKIKWLVSRDTSTQYHPVLVQYNTYVCTFAHNQTLCRDSSVFHNAPWKWLLKYNMSEQLLQCHHHSDCADENNAGQQWAFANGLINSFSLHWTVSLSPQHLAIHGMNTWVRMTDYSTCETQWHICCTQVLPLYTSLLHTQPWSDNGLPPSKTEAIKLIHMTSALCAQQPSRSSCVHTYCTQMPLQCVLC